MTSRMLRRHCLPQRQHRKSDATSGSAAVEFAMVLPVLMALVAGALNYGVLGLQMSTLISAARGGAEYAKGNPADASLTTNTTTVTGVATTTASLTCRCSDGTTATAANCAIGTGIANPCAGNARPIFSVQVGTTQNTQFVLGTLSFSSLSATAKIRFD
jgi:Flp pilus assembly protein TadG